MTIAALRTADGVPIGDLGLEIARGSVPGVTGDIKFGDNEAVGTSEITIWGVPGTVDNYFPANAVTASISSSDVDDSSAGAGARTGTIFYLDDNGDEGTEDFTLNGQTPVALANQMKRVNRIEIDSAGASGFNEGTIYLFEGTATLGVPDDLTKIINGITIDHNQTTSSFWTCPNKKRGYIRSALATSAGNKNATAKMRVRDNGTFKTKIDIDLLNNGIRLDPFIPFVMTAGDDMRVTGKVDTGTGRVSANWTTIIEDWDRI